ncbi:trypsin-like peptidase domain-containing protein [Streptomyces microflavus]|uniref:VMAP-C domain-containing protein n=1 Tax=Streptomyces microflavus TaxID=1919 RepID=UPI00379EADDB
MDQARLALIRSGTQEERRGVGSGYLVAPQLVLTARHVLQDHATEAFWPVITVRVGHPKFGITAQVPAQLLWTHPDGLDVALLRIDCEVDLPGSVNWGRPVGRAPLPYEGIGYPWASLGEGREPEHLRGVLPVLSGGMDRYVLDQEPAPAPRTGDRKAWGGTSGAGVFCGGHLVGVVTQEPRTYGARRLIALPVSSFACDSDFVSHMEEHAGRPPGLHDIGAALPEARPVAERTQAERELEQLLGPLFPHPGARYDYARLLARELGYEATGFEPTGADLVALLLRHRRAMASLGEALVGSAQGVVREGLTCLFSRARALGCASLLSQNEYDTLLGLLRRVCEAQPALLSQAAGEALRYIVLPDVLSRPQLEEDDLCEVVEGLEDLSDSEVVPAGTPAVPALLKLVEYVAGAAGGELARDLHTWSEGTAGRLGVRPEALEERRADAVRWAKRPLSPVSRVVMELERDGTAEEERYWCRILLVRGNGSHRVLAEKETASRTRRELAMSLREAVVVARQEQGQNDQVPWVTLVVDREGLHLAFDEWVLPEPGGILPEWPMGAHYRVSLSCPEISDQVPEREDDQARRWKNGRATVLVADRTSGDVQQFVKVLRTQHRDLARVILHGPADERRSRLLCCLALGVPVVLWDRDAEGYEDAARLDGLAPAGDLGGLPDRVRAFRGGSAESRPTERRARPALVWEPEDHAPRTGSLRLRDPWRGTHAS